MSTLSRPVRPPSPDLGYREILRLFLPLAATSTMMSASVPIINAGLARTPDPETHLAAFGLAFTLGIFLESPVFAIQQAVVAWYAGSERFAPLVRYSFAVGFIVFVYESAVAFSPLAPFLFHRLMGANPELSAAATRTLRVMVVFPVLIAVRSALQGVLISRRTTMPIGWGTLLRLSTLAVLIFTVVPNLPGDGPAASMACLGGAVVVEMICMAVFVYRSRPVEGLSSPARDAGLTKGSRTRFILPLMGMMALGTLTNPLINGFITRTEDPETGLAVYAVVASLVWFLASPFLRFSAVTITLGTGARALVRLQSFVWRAVGPLTLVLLAVQFTPLWKVLLGEVMGLSPELTERVRAPLLLLSLQPLVAAFIAHNQGILLRSARTWVIGWGGVNRVGSILAGGALGLLLGTPGWILGGVLLGLAFLGELAVLVLWRRFRAG